MAATILSAISLPFVGRLVDYTSVQKSCLIVFSGLWIAAVIIASAGSVFVIFLALYGLRLFGQGMMTHVSVTAMGRWYSAQRGRAVAVASSGLQIGEAILPILFVAALFVFDWRTLWWMSAGILLIVLPVVFILTSRERASQTSSVDEESRRTVRNWTMSEALKDPIFWFLIVAAGTPSFIGTVIFFHQSHIIEIKGWSLEAFAASFFVMSFSTILFSFVFGLLVDRFGTVRLIALLLLPLGLAAIMLALIEKEWVLFLFMMLFGVSYGAQNAFMGTLWPEVYGLKYLGSIRSVVIGFAVFGSAAGPGMTGILIDLEVSFETQLIAMGLFALVLSAIMVAVSVLLIQRMQHQSAGNMR